MDEWLGFGPSGSVQRSAPVDAVGYDEQLREWAKGGRCVEAATELLIRGFGGRFAMPGQAWIQVGNGREACIDFAAIPENIGGLSGGEKSFLLLVASLAQAGVSVSVGLQASRLDHPRTDLLLAAIAHAAGFGGETVVSVENADGSFSLERRPALYPWPDKSRPVVEADE